MDPIHGEDRTPKNLQWKRKTVCTRRAVTPPDDQFTPQIWFWNEADKSRTTFSVKFDSFFPVPFTSVLASLGVVRV